MRQIVSRCTVAYHLDHEKPRGITTVRTVPTHSRGARIGDKISEGAGSAHEAHRGFRDEARWRLDRSGPNPTNWWRKVRNQALGYSEHYFVRIVTFSLGLCSNNDSTKSSDTAKKTGALSAAPGGVVVDVTGMI